VSLSVPSLYNSGIGVLHKPVQYNLEYFGAAVLETMNSQSPAKLTINRLSEGKCRIVEQAVPVAELSEFQSARDTMSIDRT